MHGAFWSGGQNWFLSADYCGFEGVGCSGPQVISLDLSDFDVNFPLSDAIRCFVGLKSLLLNNNNIQMFPQ